ncbi:hypothetical protein ACIA8K_36205 [Catenuloplanes sp. NPDC051500]|uniref:hypothetical protein n=1 Tax=Catenuloplanes sp. NPDC051500 TaxID=3363959 RepID=UPI00379E1D19
MRMMIKAAALAGLALPAVVHAAPIVPSGPSTLRNAGLNACLTAVSDAAVAVEPCDGGPRQVFLIQSAGDDIMLRHNGWCVRVDSGSRPVNAAHLGLCKGTAEEHFTATSLWRDSAFILRVTGYPLRAQRVGEPPVVGYAQADPGRFREWRILPPA